MASPTIESLCCASNSSPFSTKYFVELETNEYNITVIISSFFGMIGALYQLLPIQRNERLPSGESRFLKMRGQFIIKWLAFADLFACIGLFLRSSSWVNGKYMNFEENGIFFDQVFCAVLSGMIHFFYTATYFWTFLYAVDVRLLLGDVRVNQKAYHIFCWIASGILCLFGLLTLYLPDFDCHSNRADPYTQYLPNYLSTFIPIIIVMILNPFIYCSTFSKVESLLVFTRGRYTQAERQVVEILRKKFFFINAAFYVCWLPNILNGIIIWSIWSDLPKDFVIGIWYAMAVVNPLQAVFNSIVYRSWSRGTLRQPVSAYLCQPKQRFYSSRSEAGSSSVIDIARRLTFSTSKPSGSSIIQHAKKGTINERTPLLLLKRET